MEQHPKLPSATAKPPLQDGEKKKSQRNGEKRSGPFSFFKNAMFMMRRSSNDKPSKPAEEAVPSKDMLTKLVGSIRPLHLQDNQSPPHSIQQSGDALQHPPPSPHRSSFGSAGGMSRYVSANNLPELEKGSGDDLIRYSSSSSSSSSRCASSTNLVELGSESRYASALNLRELYGEDESEEDQVSETGGDEMIDAKAEEFIAQFYKQMRMQS